MTIFSDFDRVLGAPRTLGESAFEFYDRAAGIFWQDVRELIEAWFARVDATTQADLLGRLRSGDDRQFNGAFFELYLHESLLRMGYTVTCHPQLPDTDRRPDFLAEKNDESFYMEARSASVSDAVAADVARIEQVYDSLNKMESPNFRFAVDLIQHDDQPFPARTLRKRVERWISHLDPDACVLSAHAGLEDLPLLRHEDPASGWVVDIRAVGKPQKLRGRPGVRPVWMTNGDDSWVNTDGVRKALYKKGTAYGQLRAPFVVAVASGSMTLTDGEIASLLYGNGTWDLRDGRSAPAHGLVRRQPNGFWYAGDHWNHQGVSAVLVVSLLRPATIGEQQHTIWEHPASEFPIVELPLWRRAIYENGLPTFALPSRTQAEWFDLGKKWPRGDPYGA